MEDIDNPQDGTTANRIKETIQNFQGKAAVGAARAGESIENMREKAAVYQQGAEELIDSLGAYIKENPQRSAVIAAGVGIGMGVIVGLLLRNRN